MLWALILSSMFLPDYTTRLFQCADTFRQMCRHFSSNVPTHWFFDHKYTLNYFSVADMVTAPPIPLSLDCPPHAWDKMDITLWQNIHGAYSQTCAYRVVSASCRLLLCVWCQSLFGKETLASNNLLAQITPRPSMMPRHDLHSRQNVEHTWGPSL